MRLSDRDRVLILAFGNVARGDDSLGIRFGECISNENVENVDVEMDYQLKIEMSADLLNYDKVVFVDASVSCREPFEFYKIEPDTSLGFTTHSMKPETLLTVCKSCFGKTPTETWILAIRGYNFDLADEISERALKNLSDALEFFRNNLVLKRRYEDGTEEKNYIDY
ncbi:MAG: hydrogenase maturation protease [Candidatus Hydrogenedentes bacterium]|nr:hydrogenase maturation protease [Candidatus Hydrogenedentota bacterium]